MHSRFWVLVLFFYKFPYNRLYRSWKLSIERLLFGGAGLSFVIHCFLGAFNIMVEGWRVRRKVI